MKYFKDLIETLYLIDENAETRAKAKEFKKSMKPFIKRVGDAQIGDPRRYAYMLLWPFLRDELGIEDMQGQDTPVNSALIQRKLEELDGSGLLPADAGAKFEQYAKDNYDTFVNRISAMRPKNKGEFVGYDEEESASERAERVRVERELQAAKAKEAPQGYDLGIDQDDIIDQEFKSVVSDIADSLGTRSSTSIIEIFVNPADGPVVQKKALLNLFPQEDLVGPPEIEPDKFVFEIKPNSKLSQLIASRGPDSIENYLQDKFSQLLQRDTRVVIHAPEEGGKYEEPLPDTAPAPQAQDSMSQYGGVSYESAKASIGHLIPDEWKSNKQVLLESRTTGEFDIETGKGPYKVIMVNGKVQSCDPLRADGPEVNLAALQKRLSAGHNVRDAIISSWNVQRAGGPPTEKMGIVQRYMPESWKPGKYEKPICETSRERFKPTKSSQIPLYRPY